MGLLTEQCIAGFAEQQFVASLILISIILLAYANVLPSVETTRCGAALSDGSYDPPSLDQRGGSAVLDKEDREFLYALGMLMATMINHLRINGEEAIEEANKQMTKLQEIVQERL